MAGPVPDLDVYWKVGQAILAGAVDAFTVSGVPVPDLRYVTTRGPVLLETDCGCDQLIVHLGAIADPAEFAISPDRCASRFAVEAQVLFGMCITEFVGNKGVPCAQPIGDPGDPCGDPFVAPTAPGPGEPASLAYETWLASRIRWVMANGVAACVSDAVCECLGDRVCTVSAKRGRVTGLAEGLCEWSELAITVVL